VLKTRLSIYKSYLANRTKTASQLEKKYNDIITALDEVIDQMNAQIILRLNNEKLLEELKVDLDPEENNPETP